MTLFRNIKFTALALVAGLTMGLAPAATFAGGRGGGGHFGGGGFHASVGYGGGFGGYHGGFGGYHGYYGRSWYGYGCGNGWGWGCPGLSFGFGLGWPGYYYANSYPVYTSPGVTYYPSYYYPSYSYPSDSYYYCPTYSYYPAVGFGIGVYPHRYYAPTYYYGGRGSYLYSPGRYNYR